MCKLLVKVVTEWATGIFTDYIGKVFKESLASDLAKAHYYCVFSDSSTNSTVIEQELVSVLFMLRGHLNANVYQLKVVKMLILKGLWNALIKHLSTLE